MTHPKSETGIGGSGAMRVEEVAEVPAGSVGRWRIHTRNTLHILALGPSFGIDPDDQSIYQRVPGSNSGAFVIDGLILRPTRIDLWPRVGWRFMLRVDDPARPHQFERWHATSPVRRIEHVLDVTPRP